jgi:hypothetical protein
MGLLNYTTSVSTAKSVGEIISLLIQAKARAVMQDFDGTGNVTAISFRCATQFGEMAFRLPMDVLAVQQVLKNQHKARKIQRRYANDSEHARRVGWRILKNWAEAQLALIETGMVKVEQVFLPYAQNAQGMTVYEALVEKKFSGLALPAPNDQAKSEKIISMA